MNPPEEIFCSISAISWDFRIILFLDLFFKVQKDFSLSLVG